MAPRRSTLSSTATLILAVACADPTTEPTSVAPSFHRDGGGTGRWWLTPMAGTTRPRSRQASTWRPRAVASGSCPGRTPRCS